MEILVLIPGLLLIIVLSQYVNFTMALVLGMMVIVPATGILYIIGKAIERRYPKRVSEEWLNQRYPDRMLWKEPGYARPRPARHDINLMSRPAHAPMAPAPQAQVLEQVSMPEPSSSLLPRSLWDLPGDTSMQRYLDTITREDDRAYILSLPRHDRKGLCRQWLA